MGSSELPQLLKCPVCSCGNSQDAGICSFCCAILDFDSSGQLMADGVVCTACGRELSQTADRCTGCREPILQMCPACQGEKMRLRDRKCPDCGMRREEFFEVCVRQRRNAEWASWKEQRRRPHVFLWLNIPLILAFVAASVRACVAGQTKLQIAMLVSGAIFLVLAVIPFWGRPKPPSVES